VGEIPPFGDEILDPLADPGAPPPQGG